MNQIIFSTNWNNKLDNKVFSTIRLQNTHKYKLQEIYEIIDKSQNKTFQAVCVYIHHFQLQNLPEGTAWLDTGYSRAETIRIIERMYKHKDVNVHQSMFSLILLKKI